MRKLTFVTLAILMVATVGAQTRFSLSVELSGPSKSGISLGGKNISVSYMNRGVSNDSLFLACAAEGFAQALEEDYFNGKEAIGIYKVDSSDETDYTSKEGMVSLVVDTGADVAFLFDMAGGDNPSSFEMRLYTYDSMNKADTVRVFRGKGTISGTNLAIHGQNVGEKSAEYFTPTWTSTNFAFYYYASGSWPDAAEYASKYKFKEAIDIWLEYTDHKNLQKRSVAEFNIATACFILGQKELALRWLDRSDSHYPLADSATLRRKINK